MVYEHLWGWKLWNLAGQLVPILSHPRSGEVFYVVPVSSCTILGYQWKGSVSIFFTHMRYWSPWIRSASAHFSSLSVHQHPVEEEWVGQSDSISGLPLKKKKQTEIICNKCVWVLLMANLTDTNQVILLALSKTLQFGFAQNRSRTDLHCASLTCVPYVCWTWPAALWSMWMFGLFHVD